MAETLCARLINILAKLNLCKPDFSSIGKIFQGRG